MTKGALTRQAILDHGVEVAATVGLDGLTIGSLANRTGMSKSGLYAHFGSKETLQLDVLRHAREQFSDLVVRPALTVARGEPRLRVLFERWSAAERSPGSCLFVKAASEFDDRAGPVHDQLAQDHQDMLDSIAQMCRAAISEGHFRDDVDPDQFAHELYGVMLVYFLTRRLLGSPTATARTRRAFEHLLSTHRP